MLHNQSLEYQLLEMSSQVREEEEESLYVVEEILDKKIVKGKAYYKVKWQGYGLDQCTWQVKSHLRYVRELVEAYELRSHPEEALEAHFSPPEEENKGESADDDANFKSSVQNKSEEPDDTIEKCNPNNETDSAEITAQSLRGVVDQLPVAKMHAKGKKIPIPRAAERKQEEARKRKAKREKMDNKQAEEVKVKSVNSKAKFSRNTQDSKEVNDKSSNINISKQSRQSLPRSKTINRILHRESELLQFPTDLDQNPSKSILHIKNEEEDDPEEKVDKEESGLRKIRVLGDQEAGDKIKDYLVEFSDLSLKVLTSLQLMMSHPIEFIQYLEKKAHKQ